MNTDLIRYSTIKEKNPREIVLLRGSGCKWLKCRFCNYHLDYSRNEHDNWELNKKVLSEVTGKYGRLEVINSGSFADLDQNTMDDIAEICLKKQIRTLHFESHWMHREEVSDLHKHFKNKGIQIKLKIGVETFDYKFREEVLVKGIHTDSPNEIAKYFDEVCLLQGITGQTTKSMQQDIETGLAYFERVCINIMKENGMPIKPSRQVIDEFITYIYPKYKNNNRVDILLDNTDFGVGGTEHE